MNLGYDKPLYIQPFDHRGSFQIKLFGWKGALTEAQTAEIASTKRVIYDGFKSAVAGGVPKEKAGILVDEQFGASILRDAEADGYMILLKSHSSIKGGLCGSPGALRVTPRDSSTGDGF